MYYQKIPYLNEYLVGEDMIFKIVFALMFAGVAVAQENKTTVVPKTYFQFWNSKFSITDNNNCYNYATNRVTNSFAQPGEASNAIYEELTCTSVYEAAAKDLGLVPATYFPYNNKNDETLIALVVAPHDDFHWYRRDDDGNWTHKMGGTPATKFDDSNNIITDPETADRGYYTDFCGYFKVKNFPEDSHDQDGGYVKIGNMSNLPSPSVRSVVTLHKYSGRRNPQYDLKELLKSKTSEVNLLSLQSQNRLGFNQQVSKFKPKLGEEYITIHDVDGLLGVKGARILIQKNDPNFQSILSALSADIK
jgi:hypothetical protein